MLPNVENGDVTSCVSSGLPADANANAARGQRSFTKSLSANSISSAACPSSELLSNLDGQLCLVALEHLLMLVASQSIYVIRSQELEPRWKQIVRRDISSELLSFHEFVRRKVIVDYRDSRCQWVRRKHGMYKVKPSDGAARNVTTQLVRRSTSSSTTNELRVNVVRRLHLQQQLHAPQTTESQFEMTRMLSPIGPSGAQHLEASTPQGAMDIGETPRAHLENRKRFHANQQADELLVEDEPLAIEVQYFPYNGHRLQ